MQSFKKGLKKVADASNAMSNALFRVLQKSQVPARHPIGSMNEYRVHRELSHNMTTLNGGKYRQYLSRLLS